MELYKDNFSIFIYKGEDDLYIGINLDHFYKMLKSIKKKDSIVLFIKEDTKNDLGIQVVPKENNRITTSHIKIQKIQNIEIPLPAQYSKPIIVPSNEYQKMCKDMNNIGTITTVESKNFYIKFLCNAASVYSKEVLFGELEEEEEEECNIISNLYKKEFNTDQLARIVKISGLSNTLYVYTSQINPIQFKSAVSNLGIIQIYVKSKDQIEQDECMLNHSASEI